MPISSLHGWGICGKYLAKELDELEQVVICAPPIDMNLIGDELEYRFLSSRLIAQETYQQLQRGGFKLSAPVLHGTESNLLIPTNPNAQGVRDVGYTFFEDNILDGPLVRKHAARFKHVVCGSRWNETVLTEYGITNATTIIQGVDPALFHPCTNAKVFNKDKFVIFSGGKFEFRKGQDIVLRAFKHLQDKYSDVLLINSWFNYWAFSFATMKHSRLIRFAPDGEDYYRNMLKVYVDNGINPQNVVTLSPKRNVEMARIYRNSDIGLFPNRCEGGTNLVLMEYMACGKPVIATFNTGHQDILTEQNSLQITTHATVDIVEQGKRTARWSDPDLDETIAKLEWAYLHRDALDALAHQAGQDLSRITWKETARKFHALLTQ